MFKGMMISNNFIRERKDSYLSLILCLIRIRKINLSKKTKKIKPETSRFHSIEIKSLLMEKPFTKIGGKLKKGF